MIIILCREVDKDTGEIAVYTIDKEPVTDRLIWCLKIRARANPELRYFAVLKSRWLEERAEYERMLRRKQVTHRMLNAIGGLEEL